MRRYLAIDKQYKCYPSMKTVQKHYHHNSLATDGIRNRNSTYGDNTAMFTPTRISLVQSNVRKHNSIYDQPLHTRNLGNLKEIGFTIPTWDKQV